MTIPFDLIESDSWPLLRQKIAAERERRLNDLLHVATLEGMRKEQGFIDALDWIVDEAKPKPRPSEDELDD